jgi:predicted small secreted protein
LKVTQWGKPPAVPGDSLLEKIMTHRILAVLMLIGIIASIAGCNTMAGFGKDVERVGQATENSANRNR